MSYYSIHTLTSAGNRQNSEITNALSIFLYAFTKADSRPANDTLLMDPQNTVPVTDETESMKEKALHAAETAQDWTNDTLSAAENYIRKNPWFVIGGVLLAGAVIAALVPRPHRKPDRLQAIKDWLADAYRQVSDQLPHKADVQSTARSIHVPQGLKSLGEKLHLW